MERDLKEEAKKLIDDLPPLSLRKFERSLAYRNESKLDCCLTSSVA